MGRTAQTEASRLSTNRCSKALTSSQVDIVVIAKRSLLCYRENGAIRLQRRLDYTPCCCAAYPSLSQEASSAGGRWRRPSLETAHRSPPWGALAA